MKCFICNQAETISGTTTVLLKREPVDLTITEVPARVCPYCGEAYVEEAIAEKLLRIAGKKIKAGTKLDECKYKLMED
jgi:YgiT-type zinc finger domain-containing protein